MEGRWLCRSLDKEQVVGTELQTAA